MMKENRRHKRFRLDAVEINGKMVFATKVKILDISIGGVSLKADRRLNIGSEYVLKLEDRNRFISVKGLVVWSSLSETREGPGGEVAPIYTAGMKFSDISAEKINELLAFIEHHDMGGAHLLSGHRMNVRFRISAPEKALLHYPEHYRVKTISLSGMLIESTQALDIESRVPMELSLQDDTPITFMGRVASCLGAAEEAGGYAIGIEFLDLTEKDKEVLSAFVEYCEEAEGGAAAPGAGAHPEEKLSDLPRGLREKIEYLHEWHKTMGYYRVLGVKEHAADHQIRHAYMALAKDFHPDRYANISDEVRNKLNEIFTYMTAAYSTLMDHRKRREYDKTASKLRK